MTRRADLKTAELVEIALLTRAAFEQDRGVAYAEIAGVPPELIERIFARPAGSFRMVEATVGGSVSGERRKRPRATP